MRRLLMIAALLVAGSSVFLARSASAAHCTGDKDHLQDESIGQPLTGPCGYFVQPVPSPSPSSTPTPTPTLPVTVENRPDVRIVQPPADDPVRVTVENQPTSTGGWSSSDSAHLADLHQFIVHLGGLIAFCLGGVVVLLLPRMF